MAVNNESTKPSILENFQRFIRKAKTTDERFRLLKVLTLIRGGNSR